jgi:hypothetical protein
VTRSRQTTARSSSPSRSSAAWTASGIDKSKKKVLARHAELKQAKHSEGTIDKMLVRITGVPFYNTSKLDFEKLKGDPNHIAANLTSYIKAFSPNARDVIEQFKFAQAVASTAVFTRACSPRGHRVYIVGVARRARYPFTAYSAA